MDRTKAHQELLHDIRLALGRVPGLVLWAMQPGGRPDDMGRPVRCGPVGMADLVGIYRGRFVAIEIKTGGAKQSPDQLTWQMCVERAGGAYRVARSVEDALEFVNAIALD